MTSPWWQTGTIYQIYPRSFQDTNGDGIGDLEGIRRRLDYVPRLGVDAIWISPIYPSPMADFGYDVADYCNIDPLFGTLDDFDRLIAEAHARGLRVILDFVPNHTSDQHPWFVESRASRSNPKRDWYIWRDPGRDGGPPNNWISNFGGSAWQFDARTGQYYYHAFLREQPDLNWRNPQVRAAMYDALRFWMRRGVDGFRVDVLWHLMKDPAFADNPPNPAWDATMPDIARLLQVNSTDHADIHDFVAELRRVVDEFPARVLIGEIYLPLEKLVAYYGRDLDGAHLPFNFQLISTTWDATHIAALIAEYERLLPAGGWPNWVLGNHDQPRVATRIGVAQARVAMLLLLTLRGTPTLYYGDELGLENVRIEPAQIRDPWALNEPGHGFGRDPERSPMPWHAGPGAGFSTMPPWLPLNADHATRNVESEAADAGSMLTLTRQLLALRRASPALRSGVYRPVASAGDLLAYERIIQGERVMIALNLGQGQCRLDVAENADWNILVSTLSGRAGTLCNGKLELAGDEGVVIGPARLMPA